MKRIVVAVAASAAAIAAGPAEAAASGPVLLHEPVTSGAPHRGQTRAKSSALVADDSREAITFPSVEVAMGSARFRRTSRLAVALSAAADSLQKRMRTLMQEETHVLAEKRAVLLQKLTDEENATNAVQAENQRLSAEVKDLMASNAAMEKSIKKAHAAMDSAPSEESSSRMQQDSADAVDEGDSSDDAADEEGGDEADDEANDDPSIEGPNANDVDQVLVGGGIEDEQQSGDDSSPVSFLATSAKVSMASGTEMELGMLLDTDVAGQGAGSLRGSTWVESEADMQKDAKIVSEGLTEMIATEKDTENALQSAFADAWKKEEQRKAAAVKENKRLKAKKQSLLLTQKKLRAEVARVKQFVQQIAESLGSSALPA